MRTIITPTQGGGVPANENQLQLATPNLEKYGFGRFWFFVPFGA
jgi:hypothetical protein